MRWLLLLALLPAQMKGQELKDTFTEVGIADARGMGGIMGASDAAEGWYLAWEQEQGVHLVLWDTTVARMPLRMAPLQKGDVVLEVVRMGNDLLVVAGQGVRRTRVLIDGNGEEHARASVKEAHPAFHPAATAPLQTVTSNIAKPLRMHRGLDNGTVVYAEATGDGGRSSVLRCLNRDLQTRWEHPVAPVKPQEHVFQRTLDAMDGKVLVQVIRARQEGGTALGGSLLLLNAADGSAVVEVPLIIEGRFHSVTNAWIDSDGGLTVTGTYRAPGRKSGSDGVFHWQVAPDGISRRSALLAFEDARFRQACRKEQRCFDRHWPHFATAVRSAGGRIIQVAELVDERENLGLYVGYGLLVAAGMAGGAMVMPAPPNMTSYQVGDLMLVEWQGPDSVAVRTIARPPIKSVPHAVDHSFNIAGVGGASGGVVLYHDAEAARMLAVDACGTDTPEVVAQAFHRMANYVLPPSRSQVVVLHPIGFDGSIRVAACPLH